MHHLSVREKSDDGAREAVSDAAPGQHRLRVRRSSDDLRRRERHDAACCGDTTASDERPGATIYPGIGSGPGSGRGPRFPNRRAITNAAVRILADYHRGQHGQTHLGPMMTTIDDRGQLRDGRIIVFPVLHA